MATMRQLHKPYHDNPETKGFMRLDEKVLHEIIPRYLNDGWQVVGCFSRLMCPTAHFYQNFRTSTPLVTTQIVLS
jgi:hypothetical protein